MSEKDLQNTSQNTSSFSKTITAVELAEKVIEATSTLIPIISSLDGDAETKKMVIEALQKLQKLAIDYTIAAAKRASARSNYWRRKATWRRR